MASATHQVRRSRGQAGLVLLAAAGVVLLGDDVVRRHSTPLASVQVVMNGYRERTDDALANVVGGPPSHPVAIFWLLAFPVLIALAAGSLRAAQHRMGVAQPTRVVTLALLVPFAALVVLRFVLEPLLPGVHDAVRLGGRSYWLLPEEALLLGLVVLAVASLSGLLLLPVLAVTGGAAAVLALDSGGNRLGGAREFLSTSVHQSLEALHVGVAGAGGALLVLWAVAAYLTTRPPPAAAPA